MVWGGQLCLITLFPKGRQVEDIGEERLEIDKPIHHISL